MSTENLGSTETTSASPGEVTRVLREMTEAGGDAEQRLFGLVYDDFRALAHSYFRSQPHGHTLQPTAVVHEAYMKLVKQDGASYKDRNHFFAVGAIAMRQILVNHAVAKGAKKRGGEMRKVQLDEAAVFHPRDDADVLVIDEALKELAKLNPKHARIVELRFFGGLTIDEVAEALGSSSRTVKREWAVCRAWLRSYLASGA